MSIADEIEKLQRLRQSGAISDADFATLKAKLITGETSVPLATTDTPPASGKALPVGQAPQVVELSSKKLKKQLIWGILMAFIGSVCWIGNLVAGNYVASRLASWLALGGTIWAIITRLRIWWHHG